MKRHSQHAQVSGYTAHMETPSDNVIPEITAYLKVQQDIRLGIIFGSMANGHPNHNSDVDIAILGDAPFSAERRITFIRSLAQLSGRAVDLVDLATAGVATTRSVLLHGRVLFSRDDTAYPEQITRMLLDTADFLPYRERILRQRRNAWIG